MQFSKARKNPSVLLLPINRTNQSNLHSSDFLSAICHELKTPLNAIIGFTELVKRKKNAANDNAAEIEDYLYEILQASDEMNELINDLLDVGSAASGNFAVDLNNKIDVLDPIKRAVKLNHNYALKRKVSISVEVAEDVKPINLDNKRMKQVLTNLISNAVKYSAEKSEVQISVRNKEKNSLQNFNL
jgi:signal transduction histidine kinase